jgi:N-acetylglucosamine-6-phosphate deacetylase
MLVLSGADLVLPGGIRSGAALVIEGDRITDITGSQAADRTTSSLAGHFIVPGFVDVHVHGLEGVDTLDGPDAIATIARRLPKYGVTSFCPTTVACAPGTLRDVLQAVHGLRDTVDSGARVLPAHLESNFINTDYRGAQPLACLRSPAGALTRADPQSSADFSGREIVAEIDRAGGDVGIVTLAPELDGALDLIRHLVAAGRRVSLGHSGATLEQARAAIAHGACHATHLFNRMPLLNHRDPGLAGAILTSEQVAAEIICDGVHVHRDMVRMAVAAKGVARVMAITDGAAAAGMPDGSTASLGGREIRVRDNAAYLEDGTLAGSITTMDRVFKFLVREAGLTLSDAAQLCSTVPASEMKLKDLGSITKGAIADLVVLDRSFTVAQTYVAGRLVHAR